MAIMTEDRIAIGIVDDELDKLKVYRDAIQTNKGQEPYISNNIGDAERWIKDGKVNVLAVDQNLGNNLRGLSVIKNLQRLYQRGNKPQGIKFVLFTSGTLDAGETRDCHENDIEFLDKKTGNDNVVQNLALFLSAQSRMVDAENNSTPSANESSENATDLMKIEIISYLKGQLLSGLRKTENKNGELFVDERTKMSVSQLIEEVEQESKIGIKYLGLYARLQNTIRNLSKE